VSPRGACLSYASYLISHLTPVVCILTWATYILHYIVTVQHQHATRLALLLFVWCNMSPANFEKAR